MSKGRLWKYQWLDRTESGELRFRGETVVTAVTDYFARREAAVKLRCEPGELVEVMLNGVAT